MSLDQFRIEEKLGDGAYATVYKVKKNLDENFYALKKVKLLNLTEKERENSLNEIRLIASIRDNNIIGYKECFFDQNTYSLCLVMEYADNGDLFEKIKSHQNKSIRFEENEIWDIFIQMVLGLKALHEMNIYHRDLKAANIFLFQDGTAKLGDFNVSKIAKDGFLKTQTGTPYYASPEVWKDCGYDKKSDIWSLGCILYEMASFHPPFLSNDLEGLSKKVIKGLYQKIPENYSQELDKIVSELLQTLPEKRPSCEEILKNPIIISKLKEKNLFIVEDVKPDLLKTIKFPKNMNNIHRLSERLPPKNYDQLKLKKVDLSVFLEYINGSLSNNQENFDNKESMKSSSHQHSFPKLNDNQIISKNTDLLLAKGGKRIKYIEFIKNPHFNKKKSASPIKRAKYVNLKPKREFLLEPLSIKNEKVESGRQLFGKNNYHNNNNEVENEEHDIFHPKFDQKIPTIKKIYGYVKDSSDKREITPLKLITREKKLSPIISSEKRKVKEDNSLKLPKIQKTEQDLIEEKIIKIKEIMKAYKLDNSGILDQKNLVKNYYKGKS